MIKKEEERFSFYPLLRTVKIFLALSFFLVLLPVSLQAKVSGVCSTCHTMHNSQDGSHMQYLAPGESDTGPKDALLRGSCLGCHSSTNGSVAIDPTTLAPIVFNSSLPSYNPAKGLAAGNFYWVQTDDTKGHNIFASNPDTLTPAPGNAGAGPFCGQPTSCHANLDSTVSGVPNLNGRQGCTKCHMVSEVSNPPGYSRTQGFHHIDDGTGTKYVDNAAKGWYRFLSGHISGSNHGVIGIEDDDWEFETSTDHNEYLGVPGIKDTVGGFINCGDTMTGYCTGCHGAFHQEDTTATTGASPWIRHPSDFVLPNSGEYSAYTSYDPLVPVARPDLSGYTGSSNIINPGTDLVMCLSCHRAHGSEFFKILRWDYKGWPGNAGTNGCTRCHTSKD